MRLRDAAASVGLTLKDLGERLGVSRPTIYAYSTGALPLSKERIHQLSEITGRPKQFFEIHSSNVEGGHDFDLLKQTIDALLSAPNRMLATKLALRGAKIERDRGEIHNSAELELKAGNALLAEGNYLEAVERLSSARETFLKIGQPAFAARCSQSLGYALINLGRLERARSAFEDSEANADPACAWKGTVSLAALSEREGDYEAAESRLRKILDTADRGSGAMAYATFSLATLRGSTGDYRASYELNQDCLRLAVEGGYKDQVLERYIQLGFAALWLGQYEAGSLWLIRAVDGATHLGDNARLTYGKLAIARMQMVCGKLGDARQTCVEVLSEATAKEYRRSEAKALCLLAEVAYSRRDWEQARDYGMQAVSFCETHTYPMGSFLSRAIVSASLVQMKEVNRARSNWELAHQNKEHQSLPFFSAAAQSVEAILAAAEGDVKSAFKNSRQALATLDSLGLKPFAAAERTRFAAYCATLGDKAQETSARTQLEGWRTQRAAMRIHRGLREQIETDAIDGAVVEVGFTHG